MASLSEAATRSISSQASMMGCRLNVPESVIAVGNKVTAPIYRALSQREGQQGRTKRTYAC